MASSGSRHETRCSRTAVAFAATVVMLVGGAGGAHADDDTTSARAAAVTAERVAQHTVSTGFHNVFLHAESGDNYALHGPAFVYEFFIGRRWGFMVRAAGFLPVVGEMSGPSGDFSGGLLDVYDQRHFGIDGLIMVARRDALATRWIVTTAAGVHAQGFSLTGSRYSPVEDISLGIGGLGKLDFMVNHWFSVSGELALGIDFLDLVDHRNPAQLVVPLALSFGVSARY